MFAAMIAIITIMITMMMMNQRTPVMSHCLRLEFLKNAFIVPSPVIFVCWNAHVNGA